MVSSRSRSKGSRRGKVKTNADQWKQTYTSIKTLSLNHLTANQHLLMAICRDVSLLPPLFYLFTSLKKFWHISIQSSIKIYEPQSLKETLTLFWQNYMVNNRTNASASAATLTTKTPIVAMEATDDNRDFALLTALITARASEYLLCALWCIVSSYLSYAILDSLMVRWIVKYSTVAAILRMFSMSLILVTFELLLTSSLSPEYDYFLHTWILISCVLTIAYIWQSYLTSDLNYVRRSRERSNTASSIEDDDQTSILHDCSDADDDGDNCDNSNISISNLNLTHSRKKFIKSLNFTTKRTINLYNITVFCVVPVGMASFITMIILLRNLFIQRLDVEQLARLLQQSKASSH